MWGVMGTGRAKKRKRAREERLAAMPILGVSIDGAALVPGSVEWKRWLKRTAAMLSDEEIEPISGLKPAKQS
jgi:hypothetical protein